MKFTRYSFFTIVFLCGLCLAIGWFWGQRSGSHDGMPASEPTPERAGAFPASADAPSQSQTTGPDRAAAGPVEVDVSRGPEALLQQAGEMTDPAERRLVLRALLRHWIAGDPDYPEELKGKFLAGLPPGPGMEHLGPEVRYAHFVSALSDPAIREAWKSAYAGHPARAEVFAQFIAGDLDRSPPEDLFETSRSWNPWEQARYNDQVLQAWARREPNRAYAWYLAHPSRFGSDAEVSVFNAWAEQDFEGLSVHLDSLQDPETRNRALSALARQMAHRDTDAALDWVDRLPTTADQDFAHDVIYRETPRGIGAVLRPEDGFPTVIRPLVDNGLRTGDRLISARTGDRQTEFFGKDLGSAVEVLLGAPGTDVTLQILRPDPHTDHYHQVELTITRQQLWLEGQEEP